MLSTALFVIAINPVDRKFVYNSLHYPSSLRRCVLFASLWWLQLPGSPCANNGDSLSCESFHYSCSIVNYTFIVHSNRLQMLSTAIGFSIPDA